MNVAELLRRAAADAPEKVALRFGSTEVEGSLTYSQLDADTDRVAGGIQAAGVEAGDRVAIAMPNVPSFASAYFGILRAGAVAVPINVMLTLPEIGHVLRDAGAKVVLAADSCRQAIQAAEEAPSVDRVFTTGSWGELGEAGVFEDVQRGPDDLAVLAYTSGTTGEAKGAMLSHGNLLANLGQQMQVPEAHVTEEDVLFLALPFFHIFGLNVTLGLLVKNAASGLLVERFEPIAALRLIQEHKATVVFGAPPMYVAWVETPGSDQYDLSSVRLAVSGAAPLPQEVLRSFYDLHGIHIYEGYGLTETAPTLTSNRMTDAPRPGSVGMPLPDVELRLLGDDGTDVELGDPGEVVVKGPNVFKGYWQREELTRQVFTDDGWFKTGDVAVQDEDGYLYLVDRKRDLIIVSGFNVFPAEVEEALKEHPDVVEAGVIGIPHQYTGEAVKAFVVLGSGASVTERELLDYLSRRLARFKLPESIEFVDELPRLLTGKVLRRVLRT